MPALASCDRSELKHTYGITISNNQKGLETSFQDLNQTCEDLVQHAEMYLEIDSRIYTIRFELKPRTKHLHLHGVLATSRPIRYTDWKVKGMQVYIRKLVKPQGWLDYINKRHPYQTESEYWFIQLNRTYSFI